MWVFGSLEVPFGSHIITMQDCMVGISVADIIVDLGILMPIFLYTLKYMIRFIIFCYVMHYANWSFTLHALFSIFFIPLSLENPSLTPFGSHWDSQSWFLGHLLAHRFMWPVWPLATWVGMWCKLANWNNPKSSLLKMLGNVLVPLVHNCKGVGLEALMNAFSCPSHSPVSFVYDAVIRELGWYAISNRGKNKRGTKTEREHLKDINWNPTRTEGRSTITSDSFMQQ